MKLSLDWLSDHVDLSGIAVTEIEDKLTTRTAEVEGIHLVERHTEGVVVAEIVEARPIGGGPASVVRVDLGGHFAHTVCGARNVRVGMKSAWVPAGRAVGGKRIELGQLHGHPTEGMLASASELGLGPGHEGILDLPPELPLGADLGALIPPRDQLIEIDNKSLTHRPDLWGHFGFARELAAIFDRPLRPLAMADLDAFAGLPIFPISVEDFADTPCYSATRVDVAHNGPAPIVVQRRLLALGNSVICALVDLSNYVMLEIGQPTHAFDARQIRAVRVARAGDRHPSFTTLDGKAWALRPDDLLIQDEDRPVALAGVMGGAGSEIVADTRSVLLESANFKAAKVRHTSVRLGLRTDASLRFEKKLPPLYVRWATARILHWMEAAGMRPTPTSAFSVAGDLADRTRVISLPPGYLARRAGAPIHDADVSRILGSIGIGTVPRADGGLDAIVPPFRGERDLSIKEDISEEVMRLWGYDEIAAVLPDLPIRSVAPDLRTRNHHRARRLLAQGHGWLEVQTYSWTEDEWTARLGYQPRPTADIRNPIAVGRSHLRDSLVPNLLAAASANRKHQDRYQLFELGKVFWMEGEQNREEDELAGVAVDQAAKSAEALFRGVRGALDDLARGAGLELDHRPVGRDLAPWAVRGMALELLRVGEVVGHLALLPPKLREEVADGGHVVVFALRMPAMEGALFPAPRHRPPPIFPGSWQDFTFPVPLAEGWDALRGVLAGVPRAGILERVELVDSYHPKGTGLVNLTVRFHLQGDHTLAQAEIEEFRSGAVEALKAAFTSRGWGTEWAAAR